MKHRTSGQSKVALLIAEEASAQKVGLHSPAKNVSKAIVQAATDGGGKRRV